MKVYIDGNVTVRVSGNVPLGNFEAMTETAKKEIESIQKVKDIPNHLGCSAEELLEMLEIKDIHVNYDREVIYDGH